MNATSLRYAASISSSVRLRRCFRTSTLIGAILFLLTASAGILMLCTARSSTYETYVCSSCGMSRTLHLERQGRITYWKRDLEEETKISEQLRASGKDKCVHNWLRMRRGSSYRPHFLKASSAADWGFSNMVLLQALRDEAFAKDLSAMPDPKSIWRDIATAFHYNSPRAEALFGEWWIKHDSLPFAAFWKTNGMTISSLARSASEGR